MILAPDPADDVFRKDIRDFLTSNLPPDIAARSGRGFHMHKPDMQRWHAILAERGWSAPHWPVADGGPGWTALQQHIFAEECFLADAPPLHVFGLSLVGPVISSFGNAQQKARFLPRILDGTEFWCQGFSETGAGSDLAAIRTRATRDGDAYVVSGQKLWTTDAHLADWIFLLVRTSSEAKPQEGISFLLAPMNSPGITVRPIVTIDGAHSVNEVFLDEVRVDACNLVGEPGKGWSYAKFLLGNERTDSAQVPRSKRDLRRLKQRAETTTRNGRLLADDPIFALRAAEIETELMALEYSVLRVLTASSASTEASPITSTLKIKGSELQQRISDLAIGTLGDHARVAYPDTAEDAPPLPVGPSHAAGLTSRFLYNRAVTIYAGSNEIQRNIIAKRILGL